MDEKPRRRRPPQPNIVQKMEGHVPAKESSAKKSKASSSTRKRRKRIVSATVIFILIVLVILVMMYMYFRSLQPIFISIDDMKKSIVGTYVANTVYPENDYYVIESDKIHHIEAFLSCDGMATWDIVEYDPQEGRMTAILSNTIGYSPLNEAELFKNTKASFAFEKRIDGFYLHSVKRQESVIHKKTLEWTPPTLRTPTPRPVAMPQENMYTALEIKDLELYHRGDYAYVTGSVRNNGRKTYEFIKVRAVLQDSSKSVVDTDWTYAIGGEGLRPNEETTFEMMIKDTNNRIKHVGVSLMD